MSEKLIRITRTEPRPCARPVMLGIAGDSAAGKSTLARGLVEALGGERCQCIRTDDYHSYGREERRSLDITPLAPDCNHLDILEQHLQLLALGRPVLKPVYDHRTGTLGRPEYVAPREFVVIEGLHTLQTKLTRACFDVTVFLDPPEDLRRTWKVRRDTRERGYDADSVLAELRHREPDSARFIRTQRKHADIVVRFLPQTAESGEDAGLAAELLLRPTIQHASLASLMTADLHDVLDLRIIRDADGTPTDSLVIRADADADDLRRLASVIGADPFPGAGRGHGGQPVLDELGRMDSDSRSVPLAMVQLILLRHVTGVEQADPAAASAVAAGHPGTAHP